MSIHTEALGRFVLQLQDGAAKYQRLALAREISNHLFLRSTLGTSSGELTEQDMVTILERFAIALRTIEQPKTTTQPLPIGPEAYAPKTVRDTLKHRVDALAAMEGLRAVEKALK